MPQPSPPYALSAEGRGPENPGLFDRLVKRMAPEVLGFTYWFSPTAENTSVTVRSTGHRLELTGAPELGDTFVHDQIVEGIVPGSGPLAVTARVLGVNPGRLAVSAELLVPTAEQARCSFPSEGKPQLHRAAWSWSRWRLRTAPEVPLDTRLSPFVPVPGLLVPGTWGAVAIVGIAVALLTQLVVLSVVHAHLHGALVVSVPAVVGGSIGAKTWFMVLHRRERRRDGWCVQGLVTGATAVAVALLIATGADVGVFLDATAPGLMFGLAVGRVGCLFSGCCIGRPTSSRWGMWCSDRTLGLRRVPTHLLESGLAAAVGARAFVQGVEVGPRHGGLFLSALGTYTLVRQTLLRLRAERRTSVLGSPFTAVIAAAGLATGIAVAAWT